MKKKRPNPRRSAAAKKGWATRRKVAAERSARAKKGWVTRAKKQRQVARAKTRQVGPRQKVGKKKSPARVALSEEWEVTISYTEKHGPRLDVTVRVTTDADWKREQVEAVVRRAVHGSPVSHATIHWIDWQKFGKRGTALTRPKEGTAEDLPTMHGPLLAGRWRIERVVE